MHGHLVIADISGYTRFLTESELEHANGIIGELLNAVISTIQAPLTVSSVEGDAVFMYGTMPDDVNGQAVLESVELLYCSFAESLETMALNTTCRCNACANIGSLGLKIVMHCGEFVVTSIGGNDTITGPDVIMAHRLLKNRIRETTGVSDYMLVTEACVADLGIERIVAGWTPHTEEYEFVGEVSGYVSSLPDVWEHVRSQNVDKVVQREAWLSASAYSEAPPGVVWEHLVDPVKRARWMDAHENTILNDVDGRIGPGSEYRCAHGDDELLIFTVLDRRPVDYMTFLMPLNAEIAMRYTEYVVPSGNGTRIVGHVAPLFRVSSGEPLPDDELSQYEPVLAAYPGYLETLASMADNTARQLASA